jgi:hypothetical protein
MTLQIGDEVEFISQPALNSIKRVIRDILSFGSWDAVINGGFYVLIEGSEKHKEALLDTEMANTGYLNWVVRAKNRKEPEWE